MKQRIYARGENIQKNDWIYFKNKSKWEGPVKVVARDGKSLFAVRAGRLLTINADYADLAKFEGEFLGNPSPETEMVKQTGEQQVARDEAGNRNMKYIHVPEDEVGREAEVQELPGEGENAAVATGSGPTAHRTVRAGPGREAEEGDQEVQETRDDGQEVEEVRPQGLEKVDAARLKSHDLIQYRDANGVVRGKVLGRAGKAKGPLNKWWNVQDEGTGHRRAINL